MEISKYLTGE